MTTLCVSYTCHIWVVAKNKWLMPKCFVCLKSYNCCVLFVLLFVILTCVWMCVAEIK